MTYLDRLKKLDSEKCLPCELPKLPIPPLGSYDSAHSARFQKIELTNAARDFDREWFEGRAAIYEFDAGYSRHQAERLAYLEVSKWIH